MAERRPSVLVTRPQPGAARTAAQLEAAGLRSIVIPLTKIAPVAIEIEPATMEKTGAVLATSANALRQCPAWVAERLRDKPLYAVGAATASAAGRHGFTDIRSAEGNVDDLADLVEASEDAGADITYLAGRRRTGDLEGKLRSRGFNIDVLIVYEADKVSGVTDKLYAELEDNFPSGILFHSAYAARVFANAIGEAQDEHLIENTQFFAISERAAAPLPAAWNERILVARQPTDEALIDLTSARLLAPET